MNRRKLFKKLLAVTGTGFGLGFTANSVQAKTTVKTDSKIKLQSSPIAGFQFYKGQEIWHKIANDDQLTLKAEPTNKYDKNAVEIYWQDQKLGYLPRNQNYTVSQLLKEKNQLNASIAKLQNCSNPWERIRVDIEI